MSKFKYNPDQYKNFDNPIKDKIIECFCVCGITPDLVRNSRNFYKDCFKKFSCFNLIKNKLEKTFYISIDKVSLKNCRDIYDVYNYILPKVSSVTERRKSADMVAAAFQKRADEIRWHYRDNTYYEYD
jgi:hypothetical protein